MFKIICFKKGDNVDIAKILVNIEPNINPYDWIPDLCFNDNIHLANLIINEYSGKGSDNFDVNNNNGVIIKNVCRYDSIGIFYQLINKFPDIDLHIDNDSPFRLCQPYHSKITKKLTNIFAGEYKKYYHHNGTKYIIDTDPIPDWKHTTINHVGVAYDGKLETDVIIEYMSNYTRKKSAVSH